MATVTASYNWVSGETVTPTKLNSTAAPTVVVADNEVTTAKIADGAVTNVKLASDIDASKLTTGTLPIARIADAAVTQAKLASGVATTGPAFSATTVTATTSISANTPKKVILDTETFDTDNCFVPGSGATQSRFTPTVAGYYMLNWIVVMQTGGLQMHSTIYKNGSSVASLGGCYASTADMYSSTGSGLVYLNGTTDYVELFVIHQTSTGTKSTSAFGSRLDGFLARAA
jgi:hypothetical protein